MDIRGRSYMFITLGHERVDIMATITISLIVISSQQQWCTATFKTSYNFLGMKGLI